MAAQCTCCPVHSREARQAEMNSTQMRMPTSDASEKAYAALLKAVEQESAARADFDAAAMARRSQEVAVLDSKTFDHYSGRDVYDPELVGGVGRLKAAEARAFAALQMAGAKVVEARQKDQAERQRALTEAITAGTF